jgi:peptidoglycan hydrolase-like protein with peptidoglycan-binding domain
MPVHALSLPIRTRTFAVAALVLAGLAAPATTASADDAGGASAGGAPAVATPAPTTTTTTAVPGGASAGATPPAQAVPVLTPVVHGRLGRRTLRRGAHGQDVRVLQDFLTRAGFATPIAGVFGPLTERRVKAFQHAHRLRANGVVTARVVTALRAADSRATLQQQTGTPAIAAPAGSATLLADGSATPPAGAPATIQAVIAAANRIASTPYLWGGGHQTWDDTGYDCSGSVSYALHGGALLDASEDSSGLMSYGQSGPGRWITIYSNPDHVYMVVAGLRYDTSGAKPSRWQSAMRTGDGFTVRHPAGY